MTTTRFGTILLALLLTLAGAARAACRVEPRATVPLALVDGHILVTVTVNDTDANFIVDTGAERTLMGEDAVRQLGVQRDTWVASAVRGIGGIEQRPNALPRSLRLGGVTLRRRTLIGDNSVTVGPLPLSFVDGRPIAGLLGRDFLASFDLDIDLPANRMALLEVTDCTDRFLPWTKPYAAIPATTPMDTALVLQVELDGHPLRALLDTGASATLVAAPGMFRLGLTLALLARDPDGIATGVGPASPQMRLHRFTTLRVGPEVTREPQLWVAPVHLVPIVDMLLGVDWLQSRRVWLSFATKQVFVMTQ